MRTLSSAELLGGSQAVHIEHLGTWYVLRATRSGKLILTK
ncbi:MAG: hemin uptake protein HemP [Betaproteobacteria bacterium]|nr:MAG: hemin uptake protein HemP [Betaproteobacteria bacterium]